MARGDELLIVDGIDGDREGMRRLFEEAGYVCTAVDNASEARDLLSRKFFPAALVDLDVEMPGSGVELVRFIRERSKQTGIVLLTGRRSFEGAVEAMRAGAVDVVFKRPDQVEHLREVVDAAAERYRATDHQGELLREVTAVLDDAFAIMLEMGRKAYADVSVSVAVFRPHVLVIDADTSFLQEIAKLVANKEWEVSAEMSGGGALDKLSHHRFDLVACRADLPDLPGAMVLKTVQAQTPETVGLVYTGPGQDGHIDRWRDGKLEDVGKPFTKPAHLVDKMESIVGNIGAMARDRRVIAAFRSAHSDFFRRYAELKQRLSRIVA